MKINPPGGGGGGGAPGVPNNGGGGAGAGGGGAFPDEIVLDGIAGGEGGRGCAIMAPMLCKFDIFASSGIEDPTCFTMSSSRIRLTASIFNWK